MWTKHCQACQQSKVSRHTKSLKCHNNAKWTESLLLILLGLRTVFKDDIKCTLAELVYGSTLRLPGEFFNTTCANNEQIDYVEQLREHMRKVKPVPTVTHGQRQIFISKHLQTSSHVFVRRDAVKLPLQRPYDGPFPFIQRKPKAYKLLINGKTVIDRLKPAFILKQSSDNTGTSSTLTTSTETKGKITRSGRQVKFPNYYRVP